MEIHDFRKKLIEVRKQKGLTQGEVAEKCKVTTRTIQRIESGIVKPRASTIKIISKSLGFDFFETSRNSFKAENKYHPSGFKYHSTVRYLKDLFNLKTNTMKKISVLLTSAILITFLSVSIIHARAQSDNPKTKKSLLIEFNEDQTVKYVEAAFTRSLTLDSLVHIKQDLEDIGIILHYKKIEFDVHNLLINLDGAVICNDGFSGSFGTGDLRTYNRNERIGFYRNYSANSESPFGTGLLN